MSTRRERKQYIAKPSQYHCVITCTDAQWQSLGGCPNLLSTATNLEFQQCPFGIVSIRDHAHSGLCPFGIPFGVVSFGDVSFGQLSVYLAGLIPKGGMEFLKLFSNLNQDLNNSVYRIRAMAIKCVKV